MNYLPISLVCLCWMFTGSTAARMSPGDWSGGLPDYSYSSDNTAIYVSDISTMANIKYSFFDEDLQKLNTSCGEFGKYGEGKTMDFTGVVVHIHNSDNETNHTGCSFELFDGNIPTNGTPWIALIQRGGCNFEDKVKNAHGKHAAGVIIYNDRESKNLDKMKLLDKNREILTRLFSIIIMAGSILLRIQETNDLGVKYTTDLNYSVHINNITEKAFRTLGFVLRNSKYFHSVSTLRTLYDSIVKVFSSRSQLCGIRIKANKFLRHLYCRTYGCYPFLYPSLFVAGCYGYDTLDGRGNISAVFTYKFKGMELASLVDKGIEVILNVTVGTKQIHAPGNMNKTSVLFVSISFLLLMVMSISWLIFYYIQRFRYIHAKDRLSKRLCSAAKKALSKIPIKNLKVEDKEIQGDGECCAVCIEPYKLSDVLRILPCRHDFHKSCIDPWLLEHRTCPMCKMDILKYYGFVFTGSQESILQLDIEEGERRTTSTGPGSPNPHAPTETSSYDLDHSERSSRASSPDELTPSLHSLPHTSNHHSTLPPEKRLQEQPLPKKHSQEKSSSQSCVPSQSSFYIVCEKNPKEKITDVTDSSKPSHKNSNSEPTTPSKSCICIKETITKYNIDESRGSVSVSPLVADKESSKILPRVHSSPSCSRGVESPPYSNASCKHYDV